MSSSQGKFVWYELMTSDTKGAEAFYRRVIGWDAQDAGMQGTEYTLFTVGETQVAGLMAVPEAARAAGARPSWLGYVAVDDVDASAAQAAREGGTVHRAPNDIPGVGRFAIMSDPHGAMLALFKGASESPPSPPSPPPPQTPGRVGWRELSAGDREADFAFYAKLFGWTKADTHDMGPMGLYQLFAAGGEMTGGMMTKPDEVPAPFWLYYFNVDAVDAAAARVRDGGGQIVNGPNEVPGGAWIVQCRDPQHAMFALLGPRR